MVFRNISIDEVCLNIPSQSFSFFYNATQSLINTPSRYISFIKLYGKLFTEKIDGIKSKQKKLKSLVKELKQDAIEKQEKLAEKQSKANSALDMISNTMKNANVHKEEMEVLKGKTEEENVQLERRKKDIEAELAEVEPLMEEARSAVGNIKSESLSEIRSLRAPPEIIRDILEGVLRLMGTQDTSWNSMKAFNANRISKENRQAVEKLMSTKSDSFDPKSAKRASQAAAPLAAWVAANVKYSYVLDKIKPLEKEQMKLKENLSNSQHQLGELSAGLLDVDATVTKLKEQLSVYTKEAAEIEIDLTKAQSTLSAAEGLVGKLGDEYHRWQTQLKELSQEIDKLPNNCLLMAAYITYMSSETEEERSNFLSHCAKELNIDIVDAGSFFSTERERMQWQSEGLSSDKLSTENAVMMLKADLVPLLIDPTSSAINWLKQHLRHKNVESITQNSPKFKGALELAVRFGKTFIIEEIDTISSVLLQILRREFTLQEQLLSHAISQENPELEKKKNNLLKEKEELEEKLNHLQNQLLEDLANSSGDILQNKKLLDSLNQTKASSEAIAVALLESNEVQKKLQAEYDTYRELSNYGSLLYFACNEFAKCNILYLLSVSAFTDLFLRSLQSFQVALPDFYKILKLEEHNLWKNFMNVSECEREYPTHCRIKSLDPSSLDLSIIYKESNPTVPILVLAVSGTDPVSEIREIANKISQQYIEETVSLESLKLSKLMRYFNLLKRYHPEKNQKLPKINSDDDGRKDEPPDDTNVESFVIKDDLQEIQSTAENEDTGMDIEIESSNQESSEDETGVNGKRKLTKKIQDTNTQNKGKKKPKNEEKIVVWSDDSKKFGIIQSDSNNLWDTFTKLRALGCRRSG
ncbi:unnamed protein product [Diabrotica balteata]|uniref:Dynein heavy chain n=1 Tax=Diabrotica balteata TaxID=107213 RepID=A0A9N9ST19_DIABA|nr:unnamed protein product [Diabrotica balteata]